MAIAYYRIDQQGSFNKATYWLARFARIYPVYLLAFLLIAVGKLKEPDIATSLALNASLLQSWIPDYALSLNSPGWSLSVEAFFYLCFPFLLALLYRSSLSKVAILAVIFWLITQIVHTMLLNSDGYEAKNSLHSFIYYNPLMHLNAFILGIVVGAAFKHKNKLIIALQPYSTFGVVITSLILAVLVTYQKGISSWLGFEIAFTNGQLAPLFLLFIIFLSLNTGAISKVFSNKWLMLLGEASFSMYILQRPIYGIYQRILQGRIELSETAHFYLYLLLLIVISIASYKLFETPARKWIRSFGK